MELKNAVNDIKLYIDSEQVKNKIANDLDKVEILENSIMNCWQGVFELKNKKAPTAIGTQNNNSVNPSICNSRRKYTQNCIVK